MARPAAAPINRFEKRRLRSRAALLSAAIDLFQTKGVQATSVEEICDRADVSVRTFFNHFETREHLHETIAASARSSWPRRSAPCPRSRARSQRGWPTSFG